MTTFLQNCAISILLVIAGREIVTQLIIWSRRHRVTAHPTVIIGGGALAAELARILQQHPRYGLTIVGFVEDGDDCPAAEFSPHLGATLDLDTVVRQTGADVLVIADPAMSERELLDAVRTRSCLGCDLLVVPRLHHFHTQTGIADHVGSIPIMRVRTPQLNGPARIVKRARYYSCGFPADYSVAPAHSLRNCIAIGRRSELIFRQTRVGRNGELFDCLKLRSMRPVDAAESSTNWSIANDQRVSRIGRLLRRNFRRRTAATMEHPARRHDPRRAPPGAATFRRGVLGKI